MTEDPGAVGDPTRVFVALDPVTVYLETIMPLNMVVEEILQVVKHLLPGLFDPIGVVPSYSMSSSASDGVVMLVYAQSVEHIESGLGNHGFVTLNR